MKRFLRSLVIGGTCAVLTGGLFYSAAAQSDGLSTVTLKNGKVVKGYLLEVAPNERVKIKSADGSIFVFEWAEISSVKRAPAVEADPEAEETARNVAKGRRGFSVGAQGAIMLTSSDLVTTSNTSQSYEGLGLSGAALAQLFFTRNWGILTGLGVSNFGNADVRGTYATFPISMRFVTGTPDKLGLCIDVGIKFGLLAGASARKENFSTFTSSLLVGVGGYYPLTPELSLVATLSTDMQWLRFARSNFDINGGGLQVGVFYKFKSE